MRVCCVRHCTKNFTGSILIMPWMQVLLLSPFCTQKFKSLLKVTQPVSSRVTSKFWSYFKTFFVLVVVFVFIFCNTKRERGGKGAGPSNVPGTASEAYVLRHAFVLRHIFLQIGFEKATSVHVSGNSPGCQPQCKQLKIKTSHLFTTRGSNTKCKANLFGKCLLLKQE